MTRIAALSLCALTAIFAACSDSASSPDTDAGAATGSDTGTGGSDAGTGGSNTAGGCGAGPTDPNEFQSGMAFNVLPPEGVNNCPNCLPATVWVKQATDSSLDLVWGGSGRALPFTLTREASSWQLKTPLLVGFRQNTAPAQCPGDTTTLSAATFELADQVLTITGHLVKKNCDDDFSSTVEAEVTLLGKPDTKTAQALLPFGPIEPVHGVSFELDKPLNPGAIGSLVSTSGGTTVKLIPRKDNDYIVGFSTDLVLPLGGQYTLKIEGNDFTGHDTPVLGHLDVINDFGVLAQDGFESATTSGFSEATVVESFGVPALNGQRMLHIPAGSQPAMLHLQRAGAEKTLKMIVRKLDEQGCDEGKLEIAVAVVGGNKVQSVALQMGSETKVSLAGKTISVGEQQTISLPITDPGTDVLVYILGQSYQGAGCLSASLLLDDVVLQ